MPEPDSERGPDTDGNADAPAPESAPAREWWENPEEEAPPQAADAADEPAPVSDLDAPDPDALGEPPEGPGSARDPAASYMPGAPVVTSLRPMRVDSRGGTMVTVYGAGFVPGCRVFVGDDELIGDVVDAFNLRFVSPSRSGSADVVIESPSGKRSPESGPQLEFVSGPVITRAIPDEGPTEGGIEVVLEGRNFSDGCTVSLFGTHAPDVVFESAQRLRFVLPPSGDGPLEGAITVMLLDGLIGRTDGVFRYRPLVPKITVIDPARGWVSGSKLIALRGLDFHERAAVTIGGRHAIVHFRERTHLDVEIPEFEETGAVDVRVQNPDKRFDLVSQGFTYEPVPTPPKIIDVFPSSGHTTGGFTVRLVGDNFTEAVRVKVGDVTAMRRVMSAKLIDIDIPPRKLPGKVAIEVSLDEVTVRVEEAFAYVSPSAPKITSIEPRSGPTTGGVRVILEGHQFPKGASVRFAAEACKFVVVKSSNRIEVTLPPMKNPGVVDVEVSSIEAGSSVATKGFKYEVTPPPTISLVSPNRGTTGGGTELTVEGKNFADGVTVLVQGVPAKTKRISGSVLEAYTPAGDDGKMVDVSVKNPDGQTAVQKRAFLYDARYRG